MVLKNSLLAFWLLFFSPSCLALQHALKKMNGKKPNAYYFAEIKKKLHHMGMDTYEKSEPLFASWNAEYTLEDYQSPLYEFLIKEVLICDDYNTFKKKLTKDDLLTKQKNISVIQALRKWKQRSKEEKQVDDIFADDLQQLWEEVSIYQKTLSKSSNQYNNSPLMPSSASINANDFYKKYGIWLLYSSILLLGGALIWLALYMKKRNRSQKKQQKLT